MSDDTVWKIVCAGLVSGVIILMLMRSPSASPAAGTTAAAAAVSQTAHGDPSYGQTPANSLAPARRFRPFVRRDAGRPAPFWGPPPGLP